MRDWDLLAWGAALLVAAWLLGRAWPVGGPWYPRAMTDNERARIVPAMIQARGEFPVHHDGPSPDAAARNGPLTAQEARQRARRRLDDWRARHGQRD